MDKAVDPNPEFDESSTQMLYRMAPKPLLRQLLIWTSLSIVSAEGLDFQIGGLIPECAQGCFKSFIEGNFFTNYCGTSPSLQCLCSHQTPDGFTIGEGALECIVAFNQLGVCHGYEAGCKWTPANVRCAHVSGLC